MANLTRQGFRDELKKRGWSRFLDVDLNTYLDWGLQTLYAKAKFPRSSLEVATIADTVLTTVPFTAISGAGAELVGQVKAVYVKYGTSTIKLTPATEEFFLEVMWPESENDSPDSAPYPNYYYVFDLGVWLYPKAQAAVDVFIHHLLREDTFSGDSDTTGLPERFDKGVLFLTEVECYRRAHDPEGMVMAQNGFDQWLLDELGSSGQDWEEKVERILPWRG